MALGYKGEYFHVEKCAQCGKDMIITHAMANNGVYVYKKGCKKNYCCSWSCFRKYKYRMILKKPRLSADDVAWCRYARFPVPEGKKIPKDLI